MGKDFLIDPSMAFDQAAPQRVVSLIPSTTASLLDLGLGSVLVGATDYCVLPDHSPVTRVGGPINLRVEEIIALHPDLVIANKEENARAAVEALVQAGLAVWLTFPITVQAAMNDLWTIANLFRSDPAMRQVDMLERALEWARMAEAPAVRYFCPIWQDRLETGERWWMTFNQDTYPADVLRIFQGENIFAERKRRYPLLAELGHTDAQAAGERDTRYPRVGQQEIISAQPQVILLPDDPYQFDAAARADLLAVFAGTPAGRDGRIFTIDGSLITWHGTRLARALEELPPFFAAPIPDS